MGRWWSNLKGYAVGAALVGAGLAFDHALYALHADAKRPYLAFILPILVVSLYFGTRVGIVTAVLADALIYFTLIAPRYTFHLADPVEIFWLGLFLITSIAMAKVAGVAREHRRLAEENAALQEKVLSFVSHDLRQPLSAIRVAGGGILQKRPDEKLAMAIVRSSDRAVTLVEQLLDLVGLRTGKLDLKPERADLSQIVQESVGQFSAEMPEFKCGLEIEAHADGAWDRMRIEQVLFNLLTNANKYGAGKATVRVRSVGERVAVSVCDEGPGVDPKDKQAIFGRFEKASGERAPGFGLGLWICSDLVGRMGGKIDLESELGRGSTFIVTFPQHGLMRTRHH
jgi:signal transduction histidine kinase